MSKEARAKFFKEAKEMTLDLGTQYKCPKLENLSKATLFVIGLLTRDESKGKMFNRSGMTKRFIEEMKELKLVNGKKVCTSAAIDKTVVIQAVRYIYFTDKRLFNVCLNGDFDLTVKEVEYVPNLIDVKVEKK